MRYFNIRFGMYSVGESCSEIRYRPVVIDRVMEVLALLAQLSGWAVAAYIYTVNGDVGNKTVLGQIVSLILFLMFLAGSYAPARYINYPVKITSGNVVRQYTFALRTVRFINIFVGLLFPIGTLSPIYTWAAIAKPVILTVLFLGIMVYYIIAFRNR